MSRNERPLRHRSPTSEFELLARRALLLVHPRGSAQNYFVANPAGGGYRGAVRPDFVMADGRWVDFKLHVSFREKTGDVAWRPSALYSSLRKYIDHSANRHGTLTIVYRHLHGSVRDVEFPIRRGSKILLADREEFERRVRFISSERILSRLVGTDSEWIAARIRAL